jgi:hypothetical protein
MRAKIGSAYTRSSLPHQLHLRLLRQLCLCYLFWGWSPSPMGTKPPAAPSAPIQLPAPDPVQPPAPTTAALPRVTPRTFLAHTANPGQRCCHAKGNQNNTPAIAVPAHQANLVIPMACMVTTVMAFADTSQWSANSILNPGKMLENRVANCEKGCSQWPTSLADLPRASCHIWPPALRPASSSRSPTSLPTAAPLTSACRCP